MSGVMWPGLAAALSVLVLALVLVWSRRPRRAVDGLLVAHTERLRRLPRFRALARREQLVAGVATAGALLVVAGSVWMSARPVRPVFLEPDRNGRDIMLCLDVSASMDRWNRQVIDSFRGLLAELNGERLGLTIFSGSTVTVLPLTDDYQFAADRLDEAEEAFATEDYDYFTGAEAATRRGSQTGDGLMSCLQRFEKLGDERGRAVVLATDNDPVGTGIFELPEAARQAVRDEVVVYGIGTPEMRPAQAVELEDAATLTGGRLSVVEDEDAVDDLVRAIEQLERERLRPRPAGVEVDDPATPLGVAVAGLVLLLGGAVAGRRR